MDGSGEARLPQRHVTELSSFFAAHDRWLFGHAFLRTRGDRERAADLVQDTFEAAAMAWTRLRRRTGSQQRAWLLGTLANKDISDFRPSDAFRRRHPDIPHRSPPPREGFGRNTGYSR
jgi:DNA-directed RNA polymerase specialized sigma24 family protein